MRGWTGILIGGLTLYLCASLQMAFSRTTIFGGHIDFVLAGVAVLALFSSRLGGAWIGFFAGWIYGALDGANMWQYILTRTLVAYLIAVVASGGIERNWFAAFLAGLSTTIICQLAFMILAPPPAVVAFLGDTIRTAVYNGVLAMLLYAGLNRILGPRK